LRACCPLRRSARPSPAAVPAPIHRAHPMSARHWPVLAC